MTKCMAMFACSLFLTSCGAMPGLMEGLKDVQAVQAEVVRVLHEENVSVNLGNDKFLTVSLINSPLRTLTPEAKAAKARKIAEIAYLAFPHRERLERIGVVFVEHRTYFLFFNYNDGRDAHFFEARELASAAKATGLLSSAVELPAEAASAACHGPG